LIVTIVNKLLEDISNKVIIQEPSYTFIILDKQFGTGRYVGSVIKTDFIDERFKGYERIQKDKFLPIWLYCLIINDLPNENKWQEVPFEKLKKDLFKAGFEDLAKVLIGGEDFRKVRDVFDSELADMVFMHNLVDREEIRPIDYLWQKNFDEIINSIIKEIDDSLRNILKSCNTISSLFNRIRLFNSSRIIEDIIDRIVLKQIDKYKEIWLKYQSKKEV